MSMEGDKVKTSCFGRKKKNYKQNDSEGRDVASPESFNKKNGVNGRDSKTPDTTMTGKPTPDISWHLDPSKRGAKTPDTVNRKFTRTPDMSSKISDNGDRSHKHAKPVRVIHVNTAVGYPKTISKTKTSYGKCFVIPDNWDAKLNKNYARGLWNVRFNGQTGVCCTMHLDDDQIFCKRQFLAFYALPVHKIKFEDYKQWCYDASMFNSVDEYNILRDISEHYGQGSVVLRSFHNKAGVLGVELSDRFLGPMGWTRAVRLTAISRRQAVAICNHFLDSFKSHDMLTTSIQSPYPQIETDDPLAFQCNYSKSQGKIPNTKCDRSKV